MVLEHEPHALELVRRGGLVDVATEERGGGNRVFLNLKVLHKILLSEKRLFKKMQAFSSAKK